VMQKRNRALDARRELLEAKRIEMAGGREALEALRAKQKADAADKFLDELTLALGQP
jgi:hypothetical protein